MVLPIVIYGEPVLRAPGARVTEVTPETRQLVRDMLETMVDAEGVGLAAPQVGVSLQLAVIDVAGAPDRTTLFRIDGEDAKLEDWMPLAFINPEIKPGKEKARDTEGCLSFPGLRYQVTRPASITVTCTLIDDRPERDGRTITLETDGLLARAFQHETDHLHGRLFIDRLTAADKVTLKRRLREMYDELEEEEREWRRQERERARQLKSAAPSESS